MITAADTRKVKFRITKFRAGFSLDEVDDALDAIANTLEIYERGPGMLAASGVMTAEQVFALRFTETKFRDGYSQDDVDVFLDSVVLTIREYEEARANR